MSILEDNLNNAKTLRGVFFALNKLLIHDGKEIDTDNILIELELQLRSVWRGRDYRGSPKNSPKQIEKMLVKRVKNIYADNIPLDEVLSFIGYISKNYRLKEDM